MYKLISSILVLLISTMVQGQIFSELNVGFDDLAGQVDWLDIDSDGDLDLIISGLSKDEFGISFNASILYVNNGDGSFSEDKLLFESIIDILDIIDFNGDGYVDLLISEGGSSTGSTSIYINNYTGSGSFDLLTQINDFRGDGFFSDFDNDGDIDVVFSGQKLVQGRNGGWFFKTALYINENGSFIEEEFDDNPDGYFTLGMQPIDIDLDGQLEIILTGSFEEIIEGRSTNSETRLYIDNGFFLEKSILDTIGLSAGNIRVFDTDNDSYPEILMSGTYRFQTSPTSSRSESLTRLFYNQNGASLEIKESSISPTLFGHLSDGDFNNDGFSDVAQIGNSIQDNVLINFGKIYSNSDGTFSEAEDENLPDIAYGSIKWGDFDNDSDLDLAISGAYEGTFDTRTSIIFINEGSSSNSSPTTPTNLTTELVDDRFEFSWDQSTDNETNSETLTYNWYLRTETDTVISSNSFASGKRKIVENGNLGYGTSHFLNRFMEPGDYYWSIQAIDNGFQGSSFSEESFFHVNFPPIINSITKSSQLEESPFEITFDDISVTDPDSSFPDDFSIIIQGGANYNFSNNTITPLKDFFGDLTIPVIVKDQLDQSNIYELIVTIENVNDIPEITEQIMELSTEEDTPINISLDAISVTNLDVPFPSGFSLEIIEGNNYSFENNLLTPAVDFNGTLEVPIRVNDGEDDSPIFNLEIVVTPVNDIPEIVSQVDLSTPEEAPITLSFTDISVINIDGVYPDNFSMTPKEGTNYTISNLDIIPDVDFNGILEIPLTVNDGQDESNQFILEVEVTPVNDVPVITEQIVELTTDEGEALEIELNAISVINLDGPYPAEFSLNIQSGEGYTVEESFVTPDIGTLGLFIVPITVSDGRDESDVFELEVFSNRIVTSASIYIKIPRVYPNPAIEKLYIELGDNKNLRFEITNLSGQKIMLSNHSENSNHIDISKVEDGMYLLSIYKNDKFISVERIIKQSH